MINRIVVFILLPCLVLALFLSLAGVQRIEFGSDYYTFLRSVVSSYESWKLEIPTIPKIEKIAERTYDQSGLILAVLIKIANFFVGFVNIISTIINVFITIFNILIQLIQFVFTFLYCCKDFINRLRPA